MDHIAQQYTLGQFMIYCEFLLLLQFYNIVIALISWINHDIILWNLDIAILFIKSNTEPQQNINPHFLALIIIIIIFIMAFWFFEYRDKSQVD